MKYAHVYALFLVFVFHSSCGQSQTNPPQDNIKPSRANYSESQLKEADTSRVPMSMVRNVKQTRNGDVLIASYLGVFRYDARLPARMTRSDGNDGVGQGTSFTNLTSKISSPRFSSFWDVLEDRKGNLWFASKDSGVYCYNARLPARMTRSDGNDGVGQGKSFQHFTTEEGLANNRVVKIYEDKAGNIWFATGGGASRYDGKSFRNFTTKEGLSNNDLTTIMEDKTGRIWFGTRGEACFYDARLPARMTRSDGNDEVGQGKTFTVLRNKDGEAFYNVWGITEDRKGNIWFGGSIIKDRKGSELFLEDGLWRYDGRIFTKVSQRGAYAIIEDKKGNIWTTGEVNPKVWALSRYDAKSLYNKMPTVTEIKSGGRMDFLGILEANDGSIWFGSAGGVHRYDGKNFTDFKSAAGQQ
jgi:ligand-binding sensor domain-containing protein